MKHLVCVSVWIRIHAHIHSTHSASIRIRENLLWIPQLHRFVTFAAVAICKQLPSARQRPQHSKTGKTRHHFNGYTSGHDLKEEEKKSKLLWNNKKQRMHAHRTQEAVEWTREREQRMGCNWNERRPQEGEKWRVKIMWNWYFIVWITLHRVQIASQAFVQYFRPKILDLCYGFFSLFNNLTLFSLS